MMSQIIPIAPPFEQAHVERPESTAVLQPILLPYSKEIGEKKRPAVIICPGGGYDFCSEREAVPVGMRLAGHGVQAFILWYSCKRRFPTALLELATAVAYIRAHALTYDIDPARIAVMGFSAGAHLAGSLAVYWNRPLLTDIFGGGEKIRPNAHILCYPVITAGEYAHRGSIRNLVGEEYANDFNNNYTIAVSLEKQVSADTPPCFLWHTVNDDSVPVQNSLLYLSALAAHGIPFESHLFPQGVHGLSLADTCTAKAEYQINPVCGQWFDACTAWIHRGFC